jgi:hypothetical protein
MSHERRHSLPINGNDSDEVQNIIPQSLPTRNRKVYNE